MKFSLSKKILSVFLCALLVALCVVPAFAADDSVPVIVVNGYASVPLFNGDTQVFAPDAKNIAKPVATLSAALIKFVAAKNVAKIKGDVDAQASAYNAVIDAIVTACNEIFSPITCDTAGNPTNTNVGIKETDKSNSAASYSGSNLKVDLVPALAKAIGDSKTYYFTYDWRNSLTETDAIEGATVDNTVDQLNTLIERVKSETGASKVSLVGMSMGGALVNSYLANYGYSNVANVTMVSSAFQGLEYIGELFTGKIQVDGTELAGLIDDYLQSNVEMKSLLSYSSVYKLLLNNVNDIIAYDQNGNSAIDSSITGTTGNNKIKNSILLPTFAQMPGMWAFVPDEYYNDAITYMFGDNARTASYSTLVKKLDAYNAVQKFAKLNLTTAQKLGNVSVTLVSNYNTHIAPVTPKAKTLTSDGTIETVRTSGGATTAPIGETFAADYKQAAFTDKNYISPDRMIDASTCMFPEQTWFIKNMKHLGFDASGNNCDFYVWLATATKQLTVTTDSFYPQFLYYNTAAKRLSCFYTAGDVNYDGAVTLVDARLALCGAMKFVRFNANQAAPADMDSDGKVTSTDSQTIVQKVAGVA